MKIFFIKKSEITVSNFDVVFKFEKRNIEHQIGRFLTKYIGKNVFNLTNTEIILVDKKPMFANSELKFSISHSDKYVAVGFSNSEIGIDIEKFKERNLEKLSKYFKREFRTQDEFYKYWTLFEAKYKSKLEGGFETTFKLDDYYVSISSLEKSEDLKVYELFNMSKNQTSLEEIELEIKEIKIEQ